MKTYEFSAPTTFGPKRAALFSGINFELFKIFDGDITIWGMAETPGNGLLHVLFSEFKLMPGVVADGSTDGRVHQNLKHAYSSDNGQTWTIQTVSLGSGLEYNLCGLRVMGVGSRLHIFYKTQRTPMNRWGGGAADGQHGGLIATLVTDGGGSLTEFTFNIVMVGSVGYGQGSGPRATHFITGIHEGAIFDITIPGSPEPNVTHVDLFSQQSTPFDEAYADIRRLAQVANPYPGTTVVRVNANTDGAVISRLWGVRRRARLVHMRTGTDGISWESGSTAEVDADNIPPLTGTAGSTPTARRIGLSLESPLSFTASRDLATFGGYQRHSMAFAVDENDVKSFFYVFDGFEGDVDITANQIEAVYYKESPGDARFAVKELTAGSAVGIHFRNPEIWRMDDTILAMWRDSTGSDDELWYRSKKAGWGTAAVLWTDTATEFFEGVRLHPSEVDDAIVLLMSREVDGQSWDKLFRRDFDVVSETWGAEAEAGADVTTSDASAARACGATLDGDLHVLVDAVPGASPFTGARDIWYIPPDESEKVFDDDVDGGDLSPALDANDFVITIDSPRVITGTKAFVLVEHMQVGSDPILFVDSSGLYMGRVELAA